MAERDGAGRISQLTGPTVDAICNKLRIGVPRKYAAESASVAERTIMLWLQFGRQADQCRLEDCAAEHHGPPSGELTYLQFLQEVERAEADAVNIAVSAVIRGMAKDWRAGMAWLERRHPTDFIKREHHEITGSNGDPVQVTMPASASQRRSTRSQLDSRPRQGTHRRRPIGEIVISA